MVKLYLNVIPLIVVFMIFLLFFFSTDIHGFRTPESSRQNTANVIFTPYLQNSNPQIISPSNVRIIPAEEDEEPTKAGFFVGKQSPTGSISTSTIYGIPTEFPKEVVEKSPTLTQKNKKKESVGERLCRKIFNKFVKSKLGYSKEVMGPIRPNFLKNPKTGYNLELDMFEPFDSKVIDKNSIVDGIAIEYNGLQHDQFVPGMHEDYSSFEEQQYRDNLKAKICKERGIILIIVDTSIDISRIPNKTGKGKRKYINLTEEEREINIQNFLLPKLEEAYITLIQNRKRKTM